MSTVETPEGQPPSEAFGSSATPPAKKTTKRLFYLDFIRALSVIVIVLTHFNNPFLTKGGYLGWNNPFGIYIGELGVSLFLIISATALTVTYQRPYSLRHFYHRRFLGIYPMFWLAWIIGTLTLFTLHLGTPVNGGPAKSFIFTLLAVDGWVANLGIPTTYLLGEWFLGFIIMFYIVFPLLLWAVQEHPIITAALGLGIWGLSLGVVLTYPPHFSASILLPIRLPELLFGIYFATYIKKAPLWSVVPAAIVLVLSTLFPAFPENVATTGVGISAFVILAVAAKFLEFGVIKVPINLLSKYSYAVFLVHHVVIMEFYRFLAIPTFPPLYKWLAFFSICLLTYGLGAGLFHLHKKVMKYVYLALGRD